jgi:hypothetical protein
VKPKQAQGRGSKHNVPDAIPICRRLQQDTRLNASPSRLAERLEYRRPIPRAIRQKALQNLGIDRAERRIVNDIRNSRCEAAEFAAKWDISHLRQSEQSAGVEDERDCRGR